MSLSIDWKSIRNFKGTQNKGFEQLCFQLAMRMFEENGSFTEVDDTGGGDGVEFFQVRSSGNEWGWQAKFYDHSPRLRESGRKQKIINSLKRALQKHPRLERWILCTNSQFTTDEQRWFNTQLKTIIPKRRKVTLEHWSEGKIQSWLDKPEYYGIKNAFFGKLQLLPDWFQAKFDNVQHLVEEKYQHELHTKDNELYYDYLGPLLINKDFFDRCERNVNSVDAVYNQYKKAVQAMKNNSYEDMDWPDKEETFQLCDLASELISNTISELKIIRRLISANGICEARKYEADSFQKPIRDIKETLEKMYRKKKLEFKDGYISQSEDDKNRLIYARNKISSPAYTLGRILEEIFYFIRDIGISDKQHFHLLGNAGIGKTHICTSLAQEYLERKFPVIFIPGIKFNETSTIENQFLELLDIKSSFSFAEFLETLNILGRVYNIRVPIIIDGLNESVNDRGILNLIWKRDIRGLEIQIGKMSHIVLLTTCRSSYQKEIWPRDSLSNLHRYYGFSYEGDKKELIKKYFTRYRIISDLTYLSLSNFSHPLFLKIFCETKTNTDEEVYLQIGNDSVYDIFGEFIRKCNDSVYKRLKGYGFAPGKENQALATIASTAIGEKLWESNARLLDFESYRKIFGEPLLQNFFTSKAKALIDEGLLLVRDWDNQEDHIGFTYDLIGGYCIAQYLIDTYKISINTFVNSKVFLERLVSENYETRHPLAEDILECFIALFPAKTGRHLLDVLPRLKKFRQIANNSFFAFFKISGKFIRSKDVNKTKSIFERCTSSQRTTLFERGSEIFFVPSHPLNFLFFSKNLFSLSLVEKDLCWCEFLRNSGETYLLEIVQAFESNNIPGNSFTLTEQESVNDIVAEFLAWALATNIIHYRSDVSRALYKYGRKHPEKFFILLSKFVHADDIYIRERLVSNAFGLVLSACKEENKKDFVFQTVDWTYKMFFRPRAKFATTHILLRDYASQLIEAGLRKYPELEKGIDPIHIRAPFTKGGIRKWGISSDKNKREYKEGNSLIDFFFAKEKLPRLIKHDFYKPNKQAEETRGRILWRAYNLGYKFKYFEDIDQHIARWDGYGKNDKRVEKYGEKYVWMAYYELAGYMDDNNLLRESYKPKWPVRKFGEQFDPTFPEAPTERQYFQKDILGNKKIRISSWLSANNIPDVKELLVVDDLTEDKEQFVLIEAHKCQTDEKTQRQLFFWLTAIFVHKKDFSDAKKAVLNENIAGDIQPTYHEIIFNGEYPESNYFPELAKRKIDWAFKRIKVKRRYSRIAIVHKGKLLSEKKQDEFWKEMSSKFFFHDTPNHGFQREYRDSKGKLIGPVRIRITESKTPENLDSLIAAEAAKKNYQFKTINKFKEEWENVTKSVAIFMPTIDSKAGTTIAKEITNALKLNTRPGKTDLYDKNGKLASISFRYGDKYNNNHKFIYLRKDLLDSFLKKKKFKLFWSFEGEWNHWLLDGFVQHINNPHWRKFAKTIDYPS